MENVKPLVQRTYTPAQIAEAQARADAHRAEIHAAGKHEGLRLAGIYRDLAMGLAGVVIGVVIASLLLTSMYERGVMTAGAVADRILVRTVEPTLPPATLTSDELADQYDRNAAAAREEACRRGIRDPRTGRCPGEPADAQ
jgi:hypothetical protein